MSSIGWIHTIFGLVALFIYNLFGGFRPFYWLVLSSRVSVAAGMVPVFTRRPKRVWLERHAIFLSVSYIGLVGAFFSEITSRLPGTGEALRLVVGLTGALVLGIGAGLIHLDLPRSIGRIPTKFRR